MRAFRRRTAGELRDRPMPRRPPQHDRGSIDGTSEETPCRCTTPRGPRTPNSRPAWRRRPSDAAYATSSGSAMTGHLPAVTRVDAVPRSARSAPLRDAAGPGVAVGLYGAAFGAAADAAGLNVWQAMTMSLVMFTGASQFALVGVLGAGGGGAAAVGSALLLGTRLTVYGVRLVPLLSPHGLQRFGAAHWILDETTALAIAAPDRKLARLAFLAGGATIFAVWNATTVIGALGAAALGEAAQAALDAVVPAAFLALLWPRLRSDFPEAQVQRRVALGGAVVALALTPLVPPGVQVIAAVVAVALAGRPRTGERPTAAEEMR